MHSIKQIERKYTDEYELHSMDYHRNTTNHTTWWWRNIPEIELENAGFINDYNKLRLKRKENQKNGTYVLREFGLDGLSLDDETNTYHGIQSKYWKSRNLTAHDLGTFFSVIWSRLVQRNSKACGYLYHTCGIQIDAMDDFRNNPNLHSIKLPYSHIEEHKDNIDETKYLLRQPQIEALDALSEGWNNCGLLTLPCGLGKTLIISNYLKNQSYKHIFFLSPLRQQTKQSKERIEKFIPQYMSLLVDSDSGGTTDETYIFDMIEKQSCFLSITYESFFNIFASRIDEFEDSIIVVDEAHNIISNDDIHHIINDCQKSLLVTATPTTKMDENIDCQVIYEYSMRDAIENNYICDYNINIPLIDVDNDNKMDLEIPNELKNLNEDLTLKSLFLIDGLLKTGSSRCIVYCNNIDECKEFNDCFQETCDKYHGLKCWTSLFTTGIETSTTQKREDLINKFSYDNEYKFYILTSVRILNEGIDIVECDSTFISNVPNTTTNEICAVQRMCRSNRKSKININKVSQCFIWCSDMNKCMNMLQYLKYNDETHFFNKITVRSGNYQGSDSKEIENTKTINYKKTFVDYIKIKSISSIDLWKQRLDDVEKYVNKNDKFPSNEHIINDIKKLGIWVCTQKQNYKKKDGIMKNQEIYNLWMKFIGKYNELFKSNEEKWLYSLNNVNKYINENNKLPSEYNKNNDVKKLCSWVLNNKTNYKNKTGIMKNKEIYDLWTLFINEHKGLFMLNEEKWFDILDNVRKYINDNGKLPSECDINNDIKILGRWISSQKKNYMNKFFIMKNQKIYDSWTLFTNEFDSLFVTNEVKWLKTLTKVKSYINENNKLPPLEYDNKMSRWISTQKTNYEKKIQIMENQKIYDSWSLFVNEYDSLFIQNKEKWLKILDNVKKYINDNDKLPSKCDRNNRIKSMGSWILTQKQNYKKKNFIMENQEIYDLWTSFTNEYKTLLISNEEKWLYILDDIKKYINCNNKLPSSEHKNNDIQKMGIWISTQKKNHMKKIQIMKNQEIYNLWSEFTKEYEKLFLSNEEIWLNMLSDVKKYINNNNKLPLSSNKNDNIRQMNQWIQHQKHNYKNRKYNMKNPEIYDKWILFTKEYETLFMSNEEKWFNTLTNVKLYVNENDGLPCESNTNNDIKRMGTWVGHQKTNYKNHKGIMKNPEIYDKWTEFISTI
jgi:superfamily II DNA or RNA helicase